MNRISQKPTANTLHGGDTGTVLAPACEAARARGIFAPREPGGRGKWGRAGTEQARASVTRQGAEAWLLASQEAAALEPAARSPCSRPDRQQPEQPALPCPHQGLVDESGLSKPSPPFFLFILFRCFHRSHL